MESNEMTGEEAEHFWSGPPWAAWVAHTRTSRM